MTHADSVKISVLIESGIRMSWQQAVALVLDIAAAGARQPQSARHRAAALVSEGRPHRESFDDVALNRDGIVETIGDALDVSVSGLALLLGRLIPGDPVPAKDHAPMGVHFAIARALGLSPTRPFVTVDEFCGRLARFEAENRPHVLRELFERYYEFAHAEKCRIPFGVETTETAGLRGDDDDGWARDPRVERRRSRLTAHVARRLLRDADEERYYALRRMEELPVRAPQVSTDVLRRFLREADRLAFERTVSARTRVEARPASKLLRKSAQGAWPFAVLAVLALLVTVGAIAARHRSGPSVPLRSATRERNGNGASSPTVASGGEAASRTSRAATETPTGTGGKVSDAQVAEPAPPAVKVRARGDGPTHAAHGSAPQMQRASAPVTRPAAVVRPDAARRSAPVRLFGAIGKGLRRLVASTKKDAARTESAPRPGEL